MPYRISCELVMLSGLSTDNCSYRTLKLPYMQTWMVQDRLRESRYQLTPWHTELSNNTSAPISTDPPAGKALVTTVWLSIYASFHYSFKFRHMAMCFLTSLLSQSKSSLDIVPQTVYPHVQSPMSSPVQARGNWGAFGNKNHQDIPSEVPTRNAGHDEMGGTSVSSRYRLLYGINIMHLTNLLLEQFCSFLAMLQTYNYEHFLSSWHFSFANFTFFPFILVFHYIR